MALLDRAGFVGAGASQFRFIGFALTAAVNVGTPALVEVVMAQVVSRRVVSHATSRRELAGVALVVAGVCSRCSCRPAERSSGYSVGLLAWIASA